jgi:nucleotide-binding universal stress UspA family protein
MIYPIRTIVAGIAELHEEDPVLAPAIEFASRTGAVLHLVHAYALPSPMLDAYGRMGYFSAEVLQQQSRSIAEHLEKLARDAGAPATVRCHALAGSAASMIHEVSTRDEADLILVGTTRRGSLTRALLGTTAQRVVRGAPAPVLMLRAPLPGSHRRVLLTSDLSPFSAGIHESALDILETLLDGEEVEFRSLMVVQDSMPLLPAPLGSEALQVMARDALASFLRQRRHRARPVEGVVRQGDPAKMVVAEAAGWEADLVVVGTHGRSTLDRWVLGSVAERVIRESGKNVLVVPAAVEEKRTLPVPTARGAETQGGQPE